MNIGKYTFEEFKELACQFHGYPAPGILIGGYMVELAKSKLPEGTLFEALCETNKCLPDSIQLLTLCSVGNNWLKIENLGKYALSLYDKHTGKGVRVSLDCEKLKKFPEIEGWFLKLKPKAEQDTAKLLNEIEEAGDAVCSIQEIQVKAEYIHKKSMGKIAVCSSCKEAYPVSDGTTCRACQGFSLYEK